MCFSHTQGIHNNFIDYPPSQFEEKFFTYLNALKTLKKYNRIDILHSIEMKRSHFMIQI